MEAGMGHGAEFQHVLSMPHTPRQWQIAASKSGSVCDLALN